MSKIGLIISREYRNRVVKKSFLWMTFLTPVLMAALIVVPIWLASIKDDEERVVAVVDQTGLYKEFFEGLRNEECRFEVIKSTVDGQQSTDFNPLPFGTPPKTGGEYELSTLNSRLSADYSAFVIISDDLSVNSNAVTIYSQKQFPSSIRRFIESSLADYVEEQTLASYNIPKLKEMIEDARVDVKATTYKLSEEGVTTSDSDIASIVGILATMLIYMFIFVSGSQVMNSVVQEKVNRIVEVMVCSVRPWELMWGKIIAVGLTCLTQMALWVVLTMMIVGVAMGVMDISLMDGGVLQTSSMMGAVSEGGAQFSTLNSQLSILLSIDWGFVVVMFFVYFVGGYLLYSSMFAAIGASVDNESDTSQFMTPITLVVLFALYAGMYSAENPDGPLAFWCSMIPFTSPIVMMVRVPFDVPMWQLGLSLGLLALTIVGTIWLSAKIYRVGILMYG
ncbi:MAG: ABC transporter permease, partial [Paludibacteraceae bacterium]|nr:ABC transporter permease [Paludibacteraceae bacterium]